MKVVHVCITSPYIDGWGYQENLLALYMTKVGIETHIVASKNDFPSYLSEDVIEDIRAKNDEYTFDGVHIHRIETSKISDSCIITHSLKQKLEEIKPDLIFHHNVNSTSLIVCANYCKFNKCVLFADNHADEINLSKNRLWVLLYYRLLQRMACALIDKQVKLYYGVTYSRCNFLSKYYGIKSEKIQFLPIGADTENAQQIEEKSFLRERYGFKEQDHIVISGGKMGVGKGTVQLIEAVDDINAKGNNLKLILFGKFEDETTSKLAASKSFVTIHGWCDRVKTLELLKLSDIACWPVHHTTLIEDAISVGTPLILNKTQTTKHLIVGNGFWINNDLRDIINEYFSNQKLKENTLKCCREIRNALSYTTIVQHVIDDYTSIDLNGTDKKR